MQKDCNDKMNDLPDFAIIGISEHTESIKKSLERRGKMLKFLIQIPTRVFPEYGLEVELVVQHHELFKFVFICKNKVLLLF